MVGRKLWKQREYSRFKLASGKFTIIITILNKFCYGGKVLYQETE